MLINIKNFICTHWVKIVIGITILMILIMLLTGCRNDSGAASSESDSAPVINTTPPIEF